VGRSKALFRIRWTCFAAIGIGAVISLSIGWCISHSCSCMDVPGGFDKEEYWVTVGRHIEQSAFLKDVWFWFTLAVRVTAFLSVHERQRFFLVSKYIYFERCEISFGVTELRLGIQVDCWEVPSPPVEYRPEEAEVPELQLETLLEQ